MIGGKRVSKSHNKVSAFGQVDELNVLVGSSLVFLNNLNKKDFSILSKILVKIQNELFNLGNMLAVDKNVSLENMPQITNESINQLEDHINYFNNSLEELNSFILPGGNELSIRLHKVRVKCRKVERYIVSIMDKEKFDYVIVKYLNRMSDLFFVLARYAIFKLKDDELKWNPNY